MNIMAGKKELPLPIPALSFYPVQQGIGFHTGVKGQMARTAGNSDFRSQAVVLVIDDSSSIRRLLQLSLQKVYRVICAENVDDGIRMLNEYRPNFIFIDYDMPRKDGLTGIREIRSLNQQIPVVLLTGSATRELMQDALRAGADECLPKPFELSTLKTVIRHHLNRASKSNPQHASFVGT